MVSAVVDASVVLKWALREEGSDTAQSLLNRLLFAPELVFQECGNTLWRKTRIGDLTQALADQYLEIIMRAPINVIGTKQLLPKALDLAITLDHPIYDCFYLALAEERDTELITADAKFQGKAIQMLPEAGQRITLLSSITSAP